MKSSYKRLGDFIHKIDVRNKNSQNTNLLGLSMTKEFRPHASNIIGTDLSRYKVVDHWQFACDFMSTIRVRKLPVVLQENDEQIIVSPAYTTFEVIDSNELHPEYLMMWFRRSEFDRYAYFCCDSAVRGGFNWDELCDVQLPVPSIEKQREIVKEYNTIVNRIKLNEQLNQKLEETAQAFYKHWFVDFEFPNKNGQPYKSSGGNMVYNEELDQEIPELWSNLEIEKFAEVLDPHPSHRAPVKVETGYPFAGIGDIDRYGNVDKKKARVVGDEFVSKQENDYTLGNYSIGYGRVGTVGKVVRLRKQKYRFALSPTMAVINPITVNLAGYVYFAINDITFYRSVTEEMTGSTRPAIGIQLLRKIKICSYQNQEYNVIKEFNKIALKVIAITDIRAKETQLLKRVREILLARLSKVETLQTSKPL